MIFVGVVVGTTVAFTQSIDVIRQPLISSLSKFTPTVRYDGNLSTPPAASDSENVEVTQAWNDVQEQVWHNRICK